MSNDQATGFTKVWMRRDWGVVGGWEGIVVQFSVGNEIYLLSKASWSYEGCMGKWRYTSTLCLLWHYTDLRGKAMASYL